MDTGGIVPNAGSLYVPASGADGERGRYVTMVQDDRVHFVLQGSAVPYETSVEKWMEWASRMEASAAP